MRALLLSTLLSLVAMGMGDSALAEPTDTVGRSNADAADVAAFRQALACSATDPQCRVQACGRIQVDWIATRCLVTGPDAPGASASLALALEQFAGRDAAFVHKPRLAEIARLKGKARDMAAWEFLDRRAAMALAAVEVGASIEATRRRFVALKAQAATGDAQAQAELGWMYVNDVVPGGRDEAAALDLFSRAAAQGHPGGQAGMGLAYLQGWAVEKDLATAARWFEQAVAGGNTAAAYYLATVLDDGKEAPPDDPGRAAQLLRVAAKAGVAAAQNDLGVAYRFGNGLAKDLMQARHWFQEAANAGNLAAMTNLGLAAEAGEGMPQDHAAAVRWYDKAAAKGDARALYRLARLVARGQGTRRDVPRAVALLAQAGEQGQAAAWTELGRLYRSGDGVAQDLALARRHLRRAAQAGDLEGVFLLGNALFEDAPKAPEEAVEWWRKAAARGHAAAMNNLGVAYDRGAGVQENSAWAVYWYARAVHGGHRDSAVALDAALARRQPQTIAVAGANLRDAPSLQGRVLATLARGSVVYPIDRPAAGWREVYVPDGRRLGYLAELTLQPPPSTTVSAPTAGAAGASSPWPARPAARAGVSTCNTRCRNGDCYRVYGDGRKVRFQAPRKWNAATHQFEWDSGGC